MAILDVIENMDQSGRELVHRVPEGGSGEFRLGSQCIVRESQTAVFFRDGKALDALGPGRHTLSTQNIPILANILSIPFGGKSPFRAEVYFVNMREFPDQKWGTPEPIVFRDTELGMVRLRAFGAYSLQVNNPQLFVNNVVGTRGVYTTDQISNYLRSIIISSLTDLLGENMKSVLDLPQMYEELAAATKARVTDNFAALGLDVKAFFITAITPPEEVQKMMDQRSSMGALGDMNRYMQFQAAQSMRDAAQNRGAGGEGAAAGLGLGAGMGMGAAMANMMNQALQGGQATPQASPAAQPAAPAAPAATINCPNCQTPNPASSKFCNNCGTRLGALVCPTCQTENPAGSKFCNSCGTKLG
jgi:membrane protease subunit (stomatin/prohibitin family)